MSTRLIMPFDFKPVSIQRGTGSYTVPSGKYAIVTISVSGYAAGRITASGATQQAAITAENGQCGDGHFSQSFEVRLNSGDVLAPSISNANTSSTASVGASATSYIEDNTVVIVNRNSSQIALFRCNGYVRLTNRDTATATGAGNITRSVTGSGDYTFIAHEYFEVT